MADPTPLDVVDVLLVEDDDGDVLMTREAFEYHKIRNRLHVVNDGEQALQFLRREGEYADAPRPGPDPARPEPAAPRRPRGAGRAQGRPRARA